MTYVVLLRGVMPSGKNKVPMARLREVLAAAGFGNARTYIASGNVLVDTDLSPVEVAQRVHDLIHEHIGPDLGVVVRTGEELKGILQHNPFATPRHDPSRVFFALLAERPAREKVEAFLAQDLGDEALVVDGLTAYQYVPGAYGRGKVSNASIEKKLGVTATTRNRNTLARLVELAVAPIGN